jgi:hypothetical protein
VSIFWEEMQIHWLVCNSFVSDSFSLDWFKVKLKDTMVFSMKIMGVSGEHFPVHQSKTHLQFLQFDHYIYNFKPINF